MVHSLPDVLQLDLKCFPGIRYLDLLRGAILDRDILPVAVQREVVVGIVEYVNGVLPVGNPLQLDRGGPWKYCGDRPGGPGGRDPGAAS